MNTHMYIEDMWCTEEIYTLCKSIYYTRVKHCKHASPQLESRTIPRVQSTVTMYYNHSHTHTYTYNARQVCTKASHIQFAGSCPRGFAITDILEPISGWKSPAMLARTQAHIHTRTCIHTYAHCTCMNTNVHKCARTKSLGRHIRTISFYYMLPFMQNTSKGIMHARDRICTKTRTRAAEVTLIDGDRHARLPGR